MRCFKIKYRTNPTEKANVMEVSADSPQDAIKKAGVQTAWEYIVSEYITHKLGNSFIVLSAELIRHAGRE